MAWPVGRKKTAEQVETARRAQLRRFGTDPDGMLKCSFCTRRLPDDAFPRNPCSPPNRRGRNYLCRLCKSAYQRQTERKTDTPRPVARVGPDRYRCAKCRRIFAGSEFGWHVRKDRNNRSERDSYCKPCRTVKTEQWQMRDHSPETNAKLAVTRKRTRKAATRKGRHERATRTAWVVEQTRRLLAQGWTTAYLGEVLGVGRTTIGKWRDGRIGRGVYPSSEARMADLLLGIANGEMRPIDRRKRAA